MPKIEQPVSRSSRPLRILYVDDDAALRSVVARFLRGRAHVVDTASDGEEGLLMISAAAHTPEAAYDVLITDLLMPEMDGMGLIRALREANVWLPIIVYSTGVTLKRLGELAPLEIQAVVPKATRPALLAETVRKVAGLPE